MKRRRKFEAPRYEWEPPSYYEAEEYDPGLEEAILFAQRMHQASKKEKRIAHERARKRLKLQPGYKPKIELTERERYVYDTLRTENPPTKTVLAKQLGVSIERIRQIEQRAIEKLK